MALRIFASGGPFGDARADGSAWLHRQGNVWFLKTRPRERHLTLVSNLAGFESQATIECSGSTTLEVARVSMALRWALPLNG